MFLPDGVSVKNPKYTAWAVQGVRKNFNNENGNLEFPLRGVYVKVSRETLTVLDAMRRDTFANGDSLPGRNWLHVFGPGPEPGGNLMSFLSILATPEGKFVSYLLSNAGKGVKLTDGNMVSEIAFNYGTNQLAFMFPVIPDSHNFM